ncbi:MAG: DNA polymerase IV [Clostridiaceae bacterium]|nr:DNA polymerase IV [Clostridiaceae bacterium]
MSENRSCTDRIIFHCDNNAFFASVEELFHPELKKVPMAVCGDPELRHGIILAKNALAKAKGVKTAETIWQARRKCPELVLRPGRDDYGEFCERINAIYEEYSPQVERGGIDESFIDMTGSLHLFARTPREAAAQICARVRREVGVTISVGISWNKIFAKLGSDIAPPDSVLEITRDNYREVVWSQPVTALLMVGAATHEALAKMWIKTIGDLANYNVDRLESRLGRAGSLLWQYANGLDDSPVGMVGEAEPPKSIGNGCTFRRDLISRAEIRTALVALSEKVARRMRRARMKCHTVQITIKDTNLKSITRQQTSPAPIWLASDLLKEALELLDAHWVEGRPIRMLTITAQKLIPYDVPAGQVFLLEEDRAAREKAERLESAVHTIRDRFGTASITPASLIHEDLGLSRRVASEDDEDINIGEEEL